jgi:hypothetical protein
MKNLPKKHSWSRMFLLTLALLAAAMFLPHTHTSALSLLGLGFAGMIIDAQTQLSVVQAFAVAGTYVSTNTYDTGVASSQLDVGEELEIYVTVNVLGNFTANETYTLQAITSASANLAAPTVIATTRAIPSAAGAANLLFAGSRWTVPLPPGSQLLRYIGFQVVLAGTTPTITLTAELQPMNFAQEDTYHPVGTSVLS